jgi:hypothetical protein
VVCATEDRRELRELVSLSKSSRDRTLCCSTLRFVADVGVCAVQPGEVRSGQTVQLGVGCTAAEEQFELWYSCGEERVQVGLVEQLNSVVDSVSSTEPSRSLFLLK